MLSNRHYYYFYCACIIITLNWSRDIYLNVIFRIQMRARNRTRMWIICLNSIITDGNLFASRHVLGFIDSVPESKLNAFNPTLKTLIFYLFPSQAAQINNIKRIFVYRSMQSSHLAIYNSKNLSIDFELMPLLLNIFCYIFYYCCCCCLLLALPLPLPMVQSRCFLLLNHRWVSSLIAIVRIFCGAAKFSLCNSNRRF